MPPPIASTLARTPEAVAQRVFGRGLALEPVDPGARLGFDLVWSDGPKGRDLKLVAGPDNLGQDLKVALLTLTGSDLLNIRFGFDGLRVLTRPLEPGLVEEMLRLSIIKTLSLDARIKRVLSVTLTPKDPGERRWAVDVEAQTILGDAMKLALGEVDNNG
jgi:hypothetical protein